jgi:hypothetical protein
MHAGFHSKKGKIPLGRSRLDGGKIVVNLDK